MLTMSSPPRPIFYFAGSYWKQACLIYEAIPGPQNTESQGLVLFVSWTSFVKLLSFAGQTINQPGNDNSQVGPDSNSAISPAILELSFGRNPSLSKGNALELKLIHIHLVHCSSLARQGQQRAAYNAVSNNWLSFRDGSEYSYRTWDITAITFLITRKN